MTHHIASYRPAVDELGHDPSLLASVLRPYKRHCHYLKYASMRLEPDPSGYQRATCRGEFEIPESCYIDSTGHFNSVEFNICFNQMIYYALAWLVADGSVYAFRDWTMDDYWRRQLPSVLIVDFHSTFRRAIRSGHFTGELEIADIRERTGGEGGQPLIFVETLCRYWDDNGGYCHGEVRLAITDPPGRT